MKWTIKRTYTEPLTKELAKDFYEMDSVEFERTLKITRQRNLERKIDGGILIPFVWAKAYVKSEDKWYRVNGQHSSATLCYLSEEVFPKDIPVIITEFEVEDRRGLALLFMQYDSRASVRTVDDLHLINLRNNPELKAVNPGLAKRAINGVASYKHRVAKEYDTAPKTDDVVMEYYNEDTHDYLLCVQKEFSKLDPGFFHAGFMTAVYESYLEKGGRAVTFWKEVLLASNGEAGEFALDIRRKVWRNNVDAYEACMKFFRKNRTLKVA